MLVIPIVSKSKMVHTRILRATKKQIDAVAKAKGVHTNVVINTILANGLKGEFMAKKKVAKKATKKTKKY